jgi:hypothetical protein
VAGILPGSHPDSLIAFILGSSPLVLVSVMDQVEMTNSVPGWLREGVKQRARMHGITQDDYVTEVLSADMEKRPPEFKREESNGSDN